MPFLEFQVDEARARAWFSRRRAGNLWGLFSTGAGRGTVCPRRVGIPYYRVPVMRDGAGLPGASALCVDAVGGSFSFLHGLDQFREGRAACETLPVLLTPEEALARAREGLVAAVLGQRGGRKKTDLALDGAPQLFTYPLWVCICRRRRGYLDVRVLDAVSGERGGPAVRSAVLKGFAALHAGRAGSA